MPTGSSPTDRHVFKTLYYQGARVVLEDIYLALDRAGSTNPYSPVQLGRKVV